MTEKAYQGSRAPATIPNLVISPLSVKDRTFINILDHYAVDERALGTSVIDIERWLYGDEIARWSHGYDIGPQIDEDKWPQFKRWKAITETPQALDVVPSAKEISYKESSRERRLGNIDAGTRALYVHDSEVNVPINKTGLYVSKGENLRQDVNNYLAADGLVTNETQLFHNFMKSKGYTLRHDIKEFMVGGIPNRAIAAVHLEDHYFAFSKDFRNKIADQAKKHGVSYNDEKFNTVMHELIHLYDVHSEEELENLALEFYLLSASKEPAGYLVSTPKTIRSEREAYARKARIPLSRLIAQGKTPSLKNAKNIELLVEQLYAEAREKGLDEIEAQQYVDAYLNIYEKAEKADYSERGKKGDRSDKELDKELSEDEMANKEAAKEEATEETAEAESSEASE